MLDPGCRLRSPNDSLRAVTPSELPQFLRSEKTVGQQLLCRRRHLQLASSRDGKARVATDYRCRAPLSAFSSRWSGVDRPARDAALFPLVKTFHNPERAVVKVLLSCHPDTGRTPELSETHGQPELKEQCALEHKTNSPRKELRTHREVGVFAVPRGAIARGDSTRENRHAPLLTMGVTYLPWEWR